METAEALLGHPANVDPSPRPGISQRCVFRDHTALIRQIEEGVRAYPDTVTPVYVLCRFQRHVSKITRDLSAAGLPCTGIRQTDGGPWGAVFVGRHEKSLEREKVNVWPLVCALRRWFDGTPIDQMPFEEAEALITATVPALRRSHALTNLKVKARQSPIRVGDVSDWIGGPGDRVFDVLNLRPAIIAQIQNCLAREQQRGAVIAPHAVRVDTIHAAKGLQASCVLLHTGYLDGLIGSLEDTVRAAEERRVFFVGATRTSQALICFDYIPPVWPVFGRPV